MENKKSIIYLTAITTLSLSITNFFYILEESEILNLELFLSAFLLLTFHLFYYKVYNFFLNFPNKAHITKGLFISSIIGSILSLILMISAYILSAKNEFSKVLGMGKLVLPFTACIILISILSAIICFLIEAFNNKKLEKVPRKNIFFGSFIFYIGNLIMSIMVFLIVITLTIFRG